MRGLEHVYAAGDATDFAIKHGGIAAQQADAAAQAIAALGRRTGRARGRSVRRSAASCSTGGKPRYLSAEITGGHGFSSEMSDEPTLVAVRRRSQRGTSRPTSNRLTVAAPASAA